MYYKNRRMLTFSELYMIWYLLPYFTMHRLNPIRSGPLNFIPLKLGMRSEAMSTSSSIETTRMQDNSRVHYTLQLCGCLGLYQHSSKASKEVDIYNKDAIVPPFGLNNYATYNCDTDRKTGSTHVCTGHNMTGGCFVKSMHEG